MFVLEILGLVKDEVVVGVGVGLIGGEICVGLGCGEDRLKIELDVGGLVIVVGGEEIVCGGGVEFRFRRLVEKDCEGGGLVVEGGGGDEKLLKLLKFELEGFF